MRTVSIPIQSYNQSSGVGHKGLRLALPDKNPEFGGVEVAANHGQVTFQRIPEAGEPTCCRKPVSNLPVIVRHKQSTEPFLRMKTRYDVTLARAPLST